VVAILVARFCPLKHRASRMIGAAYCFKSQRYSCSTSVIVCVLTPKFAKVFRLRSISLSEMPELARHFLEPVS
jgi:hypothetical protein